MIKVVIHLKTTMKSFLIYLLMITLGVILTSCFYMAESIAFEISGIHTLEVIMVNQADRNQDTVLYTMDNLTDNDQIVMDIYALLDRYTYKNWEDYRRQQGDARVEELQTTMIFIYTKTDTYIFARSTNSYVHLDHRDAEDKTLLVSDSFTPVSVIDNTFYTELLALFKL